MILGFLEIAVFLFSIVLAINFYRKFPVVEAKLLFVQTILLSFWLLMDTLIFFSIQPQLMHQAKFVSIVSIPVLFLFTTVTYTGNKHVFRIVPPIFFWIIPSITLLLIATNYHNYLMWPKVDMIDTGHYLVMITQNSVMFWLHTAYSYMVIFIGLILLMNKFVNSPPIYRKQSAFLLFGCIFAWITNALFVLGNTAKYPLDPTPISFAIIQFIFYWGLFQYGIQRIVPLARELIVENMEDLVLALDNDDRIIDINPSFKIILRKMNVHTDFLGSNIFDLVNCIPKLSDQVKNYSEKRIFVLGEGEDATYYEVEITTIQDKLRNKIGSLIVLHDVTNIQRVMEKLEYMTSFDQLTGLYNRTLFEIELEHLDRSQKLPISIIVGDVNGLKMTNDAFGHAMGDRLLQKVTGLIKETMRTEDIIARTGGDEFTIILPQTDNQEAMEMIEEIKQSCRQSEEMPIRLSVSWGHATKTSVDENINDILKEADANMYKKKLLESKSIHGEIVASLIRTLKESSFETNEHAERMKSMSCRLGKELHLSESQMDDLSLLALLHDLGKVGISDKILEKKSKLTDAEWEIIKRHPEIGYHIASSSSDLSHISEAILSHHERWDGNGYPRSLKGEDIPYLARIIAVIDSFDVMTHNRIYKKAMTRDEAMQELQRCSGTQFDPLIVEKFCSIFQQLHTLPD